MYQHIRLRRLSNESTAASSKVVELEEFKQRENDNIFINDDVLKLKELSNKMDELEEVILVEDEPALTLPQLSNECWDNFVEELSKKYENDEIPNSGYSTEFQNATSVFQAQRCLENTVNTISATNTERVATNDKPIHSISSGEGDLNSCGIFKDRNATTCPVPETGELPKSSLNDNGKTDEIKADNSQLNEHCGTTETDENNKDIIQGNENSRPNKEQEDSDSRSKDLPELSNSRNNSCLNRHKELTGITKKYQDIKTISYQVTFHQILRSFELDKSAPAMLSTVPGFPIELDFPDFNMKEFVKFVKNFQMTENIDDVRHLWIQVKTWLSAMKPPYDSTTNYTKYHRKLNWYLTELMAQYIKFEIEHSVQNENYYKLKLESLLNTVSSLLNDDVKLKILTLLRTDFPYKPSNILDDLFKKFLTHPQLRLENNSYGNYRLKVLAYQKWMHYTNRKKQDIIAIAIKEGSAYLPRLVPKNIEDPFYNVDNSAHHIDDFDKQGTRKLLEEVVSIDILQATINKYLQVYESQLYDSYDFSLLRPYELEKSQTFCVQNNASSAASTHIQTHNSPTQPVSARHDVRHCHRRRMHHRHQHQHHHHHQHCEQHDSTNCSTGRSTHLSVGCDIHRRNRLSSSTLKSCRCNCKFLGCKNQSDTSLSHTISTNDIISLDSTDDEGENDKVSVEKSKTINQKVNHTKTQRMVRAHRHLIPSQCAGKRYTHNSKPSNIAYERKKQIGVKPKKVDTIVLDSSSDDEEIEKSTNAPVTTDDSVNLAEKPPEKSDHADNITAQDTEANNQQLQQATPTQQAAACTRAQSQSVAMPLRCALIGSLAIKPIRKEKHCIPGEVSSTTSHDDIVETQRLSQTSAISSSAQPVVGHATSGYENAREVGTVEILESSNVVAVNAVGDEDADENDEEVSNSAIFPMWGYSKVVEEATSSTEIFQRIQSLESVSVSAALRIVESAPVVAPVMPVNEEAPTCSRYVNNSARSGNETDANNQPGPTIMPLLAIEWRKSLENISNETANVGIEKLSKSCIDLAYESCSIQDTTDATSAEKQSVVSIDAAEEEELRSEQQLEGNTTPIQADSADELEKDEKATTIKSTPSLEVVGKDAENLNLDVEDSTDDNSTCHVDDETAAIDRILADIDQNLRESHEFNEKYMKAKNAAKVESVGGASEVSEAPENRTQEIISKKTTTDNLVHNVNLCASEKVIEEKSSLTDTDSDANEDVNDANSDEVSCEAVEEEVMDLLNNSNEVCKDQTVAEEMPSNENSAEVLLGTSDTIELAESLKPPRVAEEENAGNNLNDTQKDMEPNTSQLMVSENISESLDKISKSAQINDEEEVIQSEIDVINQKEVNGQTEFVLDQISESELNEIILNVENELLSDTEIIEAVVVEEQTKDDGKPLNDLTQNSKAITTEEQVKANNIVEECKSVNLNEHSTNETFFEDKVEETTATQLKATKTESHAGETETLMTSFEVETGKDVVNEVKNDQSVTEKALNTNTTGKEPADELLPTETKTTVVSESEIVEVTEPSTENYEVTLSKEDNSPLMTTLKTNQVEQANECSLTEEHEPNEGVKLSEINIGETQTHANLETSVPEKLLETAIEDIESRALEMNNISAGPKINAARVVNTTGDQDSTTTEKVELTLRNEKPESITINNNYEIVDETVSKDAQGYQETECTETFYMNTTNREDRQDRENVCNDEYSATVSATEAVNKITTQDSLNEFQKCALTADEKSETIYTEETVAELEESNEFTGAIESVNEMSIASKADNENSIVTEKKKPTSQQKEVEGIADSEKCASVEETMTEGQEEVEETSCIENLDVDLTSEELIQGTVENKVHILSGETSTIDAVKENTQNSVNELEKSLTQHNEISETIATEKTVPQSDEFNKLTVQREDLCIDGTTTFESYDESHEVREPSASTIEITNETEYTTKQTGDELIATTSIGTATAMEDVKLSQPTETVQSATESDIFVDKATPSEATYQEKSHNQTNNTADRNVEKSGNKLQFETTSISDNKFSECADIFIEEATEVPDIEPLLIVTPSASNVDASKDIVVGVEEASMQSIDDDVIENVAESKTIEEVSETIDIETTQTEKEISLNELQENNATQMWEEKTLDSCENVKVARVDVSPTDGNTDKTGNRAVEEVIVGTKDLQDFHESHTAEIHEEIEEISAEITEEVMDEENSLINTNTKQQLEENKEAEISKSHTTAETNDTCSNNAEVGSKMSEEPNSNAIAVAKEDNLKSAEQSVDGENDAAAEDAVIKSTNTAESNEKGIDADPVEGAETAAVESDEMNEYNWIVLENESEQKISNENVDIFSEKLAKTTELTESETPSLVLQNSVYANSAAETIGTAPAEDVESVEAIEETSTESPLPSHIQAAIVEETKKNGSANEEAEIVAPNTNVAEIELESTTEKVDQIRECIPTVDDDCSKKVATTVLPPNEAVTNNIRDSNSERVEETAYESNFEREQTDIEFSMNSAENIVEETQPIEATTREVLEESTQTRKKVTADAVVMEGIKESVAEKSDNAVKECESKNSVNKQTTAFATSDNTELNAFAPNTTFEYPDSRRSDKEVVDPSFSKQKSKQKLKIHKLMKSCSTQKRRSPLPCVHKKIMKSKSLRILSLKRTKSRLASGTELNQNLLLDKEETAESELTEDLVNNIAKLVIEESTEEVSESEALNEDTTFTQPTTQANDGATEKDNQESLSRVDSEELAVSMEADAEKSTVQQTTQPEVATAEDCSTLQRLPADYNSEEILAVATLINMRNKYNFIDDEALVAEVSQDISRQHSGEIAKKSAAAGLEQAEAQIAPIKKRVSFDEENLLQLFKEKRNIVKKVKKLAKKKSGKSHKTAGSLLSSGGSSGRKYVQQRLLELVNASDETDETATTESETEPLPEVPKRRQRRKVETEIDAAVEEAQPLLTEMAAPRDESKLEGVQHDNKIYPVRLTSRHKTESIIEMKSTKSTKNVGLRHVQRDLAPKTHIEEFVSDFIVPDEKVEPLCAENRLKPKSSRENVLNVSRLSVDGTKMKFKITQKDAVGKEKPTTSSQNEAQLKEIEIKKEIFSPQKIMKTRRLVVKLKRLKLSAFGIVNSKTSVVSAMSASEQTAPTNSCEDVTKTCSDSSIKTGELETNISASSNAEPDIATVVKDTANMSAKAAKKRARGKCANVLKTTSKDVEATSKEEIFTATKLTPIEEVATPPEPLSNSEQLDINFEATIESTAQTTLLDNNAEVAATLTTTHSTAKSPTKKSVENKMNTTTSTNNETSSTDASPNKERSIIKADALQEQPQSQQQPAKEHNSTAEAYSRVSSNKKGNSNRKASHRRKLEFTEEATTSNEEFTKQSTLLKNLDLMINEESASSNIIAQVAQKKSPVKTADKTEAGAVSSVSKDSAAVKTVTNKESPSMKGNKIRERSPTKKPRFTVVDSAFKAAATQKKVTIIEETTASKAMAKNEEIVVPVVSAKTEQTQESMPHENLELIKPKESTSADITVKETQEKKRQLKTTNKVKAAALISVRKDLAVVQMPIIDLLPTTQNATIEQITAEIETSTFKDNKLAKALASEKHTAVAEDSTAEAATNAELARQSTLLENLDLIKIVDPTSSITKKGAEKKRHKKSANEKTVSANEEIVLAQTSPNKALQTAPTVNAAEAVLTETSSAKTQSTVKDDRKSKKSSKKPLTVDFECIDIKKVGVLANPRRQTKGANEMKSSTSSTTQEVDKTSIIEDVQPNVDKNSVEISSVHEELLTSEDAILAEKSSSKESASVNKTSKVEKKKRPKDIENSKAENTTTATEVAKITPSTEKPTTTSDTVLTDTKIKTEPLEQIEKTHYSTENIQIKEEEISQDAVDVPETYLNVDAKRCRKEIVIKPFDVILTAEKINQQAEAHRGCRNKETLRKYQQKVVDKTVPVASDRSVRTRRAKASSKRECVETARGQLSEIDTTPSTKVINTDKVDTELVEIAEKEAPVGKTVSVPSSTSASTKRTKASSKRDNVETADERLSEIDTTNVLKKEQKTLKFVEVPTTKVVNTDKVDSELVEIGEKLASEDKNATVASKSNVRTRRTKASSKRGNVETVDEQLSEIHTNNAMKKVQETSEVVEASTEKDHPEPVANAEKEASADKAVPVASKGSARTRRTKASSKRANLQTACEPLSEIDTTKTLKKVKETHKVVEAPSIKVINTEKDQAELVENAERKATVEEKVKRASELTNSTTTTIAEVATVDIANQITENVIAELKLLSPEGLPDPEAEKEQDNTTSSSPNADSAADADVEKDTILAPSAVPVVANNCPVTKCDEEQKTALLLDSSIDIVLGNSSLMKINVNSAEEIATASTEMFAENLKENTMAKEGDSGNVTKHAPSSTKSRLDVLTAEKINSVFEKLLEEQCSPIKDSANSKAKESIVPHAQLKRQTTVNEDEGPRKASNRNSLSSVKPISAKVPEALFADDESESSNADDSTNGEQFFAPILSLDDLLIKKDEPTADVAHNFPSQEDTNTLQTAETGHGLGTPNFAVELEVETTQPSVDNTQTEQQAECANEKLEETVKCVGGEELNTNLEETDANFSLSMTDISAIDIPGDLNINSEYPDLLDAVLFEQVRQSIDCMISGTNSAKKWSQDSFATAQPTVINFNPTEPVVATEDQHHIVPLPQESNTIPTIDGKIATNNDDAIGIGQESFLGSINSLDEVEVPTTGFDLVGSFTIADFLSEAGSDLFAFPELDKTQSRSNSISSESNTCETPPPPAIDTVNEETSSDKPYESATMQCQQSQNTNSVACDHSYNKDINEVAKPKTKVRKKSTSSNTSMSSQKITPSPLKSPDLLNVFSRAKCHPKPFWKVKKMDEIKTSTPKKEEQSPNLPNAQQVPTAVKRAINLSPTDVENRQSNKKKRTGYSMPALELGIESNLLDVNVSRELPENITNTNTSEKIEKIANNADENTQKSTETPGTSQDTTKNDNANLSNKPETIIPATIVNNRSTTPIEITEVITIPAPVLIQPIIRLQSQTNRLQRIDPTPSTSQQVVTHVTAITAESQVNFTKAPLASSLKVDDNSRTIRDSTPTLDEHDKDECELSPPNKKLTINVSARKAAKEESTVGSDEPPAKRFCVESVSESMSTNELFDMLKVEKTSQKTDKVTCAAGNSPPKDSEAGSSGLGNRKKEHTPISSPTKEIKTDDVRVPQNKSPTAKTPAIKETQEPILISKETLAALRIQEQALKNNIKPTELFEPLTAESTVEESPIKATSSTIADAGYKSSPKVCTEASREKNSTPLDTTSDLPTSKNRPVAAQPKRRKSVESKSALLPSNELSKNVCNVPSFTPSSAEQSSNALVNSIQLMKQKDNTIISSSLPKETSFKSNANTGISKTYIDNNTYLAISQEKDATSKSNNVKTKDLTTTGDLKLELKIISPCQQAQLISPHSRVPPKSTHAAVPSSVPTNSNRFHPYQKKSTTPPPPPPPLTTSSSASSLLLKNRFAPHRQSRDSQSSSSTTSSEQVTHKRKDILKPNDKSYSQRLPSGVTTLPPSMHSRPSSNSQPSISSIVQPPSAIELASIKLTPQEETEISRRLEEYRATLPTAKTYGAHKENQRLVNVKEKDLRRYFAERAYRRKQAQQQRVSGSGSGDTQRSKRKANIESYESNYKKISMHTHKSDATTSGGGGIRNIVGGPAASGYQNKFKPQQNHTNRPSRPHHEYVNKFGEIEKLVEKEKKGTTASKAKPAVALTASTAWEPKMPTGDELIELLSKTKKS
ncbi:unnamed protein product [Ceratitis capitata]|uniref:(Mediterranean fruit fly) hypothetical protein n=2 Tax=Ceratitis capitata TaxID=7213 RepID=A0A811UTP4_CERCA|nr:unnamed protein product [Ceratitis capitata]